MEEAQVEVDGQEAGQGDPVADQDEPIAGQGDPVVGQEHQVACQGEAPAGQGEAVAGQEAIVAVNQAEEFHAPPPRPMMNGGPVLRRPVQDGHQDDVHQEDNEMVDGQEDPPDEDEDDNLVAAPPSRKCTYIVYGVLVGVVTVIFIAFLGLGLKFLLDYLNG